MLLFGEISKGLGLTNSALLRRSIQYFVAAEVSLSLAEALTEASDTIRSHARQGHSTSPTSIRN